MHQPHEHPSDEIEKLLGLGIALTLVIFCLEFIGGFYTHSLALLSDAWHIFIDVWSLLLSFLAIFLAKRPANDQRTFGLHRMEVVAALINGITVFLIAVGILIAAVHRFRHPQNVQIQSLLVFASIGLVLNIILAGLFYRQSHHDMNIRGAFLHILGDALGTLAVLIAGICMMVTRSNQIDPLVSVLIAGIVLWGAVRLLRDSFNTFLEGVPRGIKVTIVEKAILDVDGVLSVHDLHIWSICSHLNALAGHILVHPSHMAHQDTVLEHINQSLKTHFGITHTTIQLESKAWSGIEQVQNW